MSDIIDRIDELVTDQMAGGEPANGYDFGDPEYPRCPHCNRHWHGLPITERVARMYAMGMYDEDYRVDTDDTPVLCPGSEFIGPVRSSWKTLSIANASTGHMHIAVLVDPDALRAFQASIAGAIAEIQRAMVESIARHVDHDIIFGRIIFDEVAFYHPPRPRCPNVLINIQFGPQNWHYETRLTRESQPRLASQVDHLLFLAVDNCWPQFTAPNFPVPTSPGYDFSGYDTLADEPAHSRYSAPGWDAHHAMAIAAAARSGRRQRRGSRRRT